MNLLIRLMGLSVTVCLTIDLLNTFFKTSKKLGILFMLSEWICWILALFIFTGTVELVWIG